MTTTWRSPEREYTLTDDTFIKRELVPSDFTDKDRLPYYHASSLLSRARLENEYHTLRFIRENTTLPVPRVIERKYGENGSMTLIMERIQGVTVDDLPDENQTVAKRTAMRHLRDMRILQQLCGLRRGYIGSVSGQVPVVVPATALGLTERAWWPEIRDKADSFVFCHNDLGLHNVLVDPETYEVKAIIDWEYAGFFPQWFERSLWLYLPRDFRRAPHLFDQLREVYVRRIEEFFAPHLQNEWTPKQPPWRSPPYSCRVTDLEDTYDWVAGKEKYPRQKRVYFWSSNQTEETNVKPGFMRSLKGTVLELANWVF